MTPVEPRSHDLVVRRDREIGQARATVGKAREQLRRAERALANLETYWQLHPAETQS